MKVLTGKGGQLIVCHVECARYEFIQGFKLIFSSNTGDTADYQNHMNAEIFKICFIVLLDNVDELSVIVMDVIPHM